MSESLTLAGRNEASANAPSPVSKLKATEYLTACPDRLKNHVPGLLGLVVVISIIGLNIYLVIKYLI